MCDTPSFTLDIVLSLKTSNIWKYSVNVGFFWGFFFLICKNNMI